MNNEIVWRSPSNLALVKYWGKYGVQLPQNPSISFTLQNAYTETKLVYEAKEDNNEFSVDFYFDGVKNEAFKPKIFKLLAAMKVDLPFLTAYHFTIHSHNSLVGVLFANNLDYYWNVNY